MTGVEAISNGVPMFKSPEVHNNPPLIGCPAFWGVMFIGISFLMMHFHILQVEGITALSQIAELTFGRGWGYYYIQFTTMIVLYLAAIPHLTVCRHYYHS